MFAKNRLISVLAASAAASALASCAVGPDFKRPPAPALQNYTAEALPEKTAAADIAGGASQRFLVGQDVAADWWTLFQSDALNGLVVEALKANPSLDAAQAALRQAQYTALATGGSLFPSVTGNFNASKNGLGINGQGSVFSLFNASVAVSYVLDIFGGVRRQIESAEAASDFQRFSMEGTYLTLTSNVLTAAIQAASLEAQIAATKDIIQSQSQLLDLLNQQFELGAVAKGDVLAQQSQLAQTEASLPPLQKSLAQVRDLMAALLGRFPTQDDFGKVDLATLHLPEDLPIGIPSKLVEQRPDIQAAEANLHQASAGIGVATANMLPQFTLSATFGSAGVGVGSVSNLFDSGSLAYRLAAGIAQPLFRGGQLWYQRQAAVAGYDRASALYRGTVLAAFQNVADVLHALQLDAETLRVQLYAETSAQQSLDITQERLRAGAVSYLDLLNAERTYEQARILLVIAQANRYADTVALFVALGGGWWHRDDTVAMGATASSVASGNAAPSP